MCTHLRIRGGGSRLHIIRSIPRYRAPAGVRQRWFYACECTHAALSLEARHWLLKRVAGVGSGAAAAGEPFRTGDHGEAAQCVGWPRGLTYATYRLRSSSDASSLLGPNCLNLLLLLMHRYCTAPTIAVSILKRCCSGSAIQQ